MSIDAAQAKLTRGLKDLRAQWSMARDVWRDPVADAFEEAVLLSLEHDLRATLAAMDHLRGALSQAKHDCS